MASAQAGSIGVQGQFANGLAALFLACGQDVACVAEAAMGSVRLERTEAGDLYASVCLPNLIVGTVGGGTGTPTARAAALTSGEFTQAHATLGRRAATSTDQTASDPPPGNEVPSFLLQGDEPAPTNVRRER